VKCSAEEAASTQLLQASMQLYVLAESRPRPNAENWVEIACVNRGGVAHILCYVNPIDAYIERESHRLKGKIYDVLPLGLLDPTPFIERGQGRLNFGIVYGFCARNGQLLTEPSNGTSLMGTAAWKGFTIPQEITPPFKLEFGSMHEGLGRIFSTAGLPRQSIVLQDCATYSPVELERTAREALLRAPKRIYRNQGNEFSIYDPIERRWRFGSLSRIRTYSIN
jgi:hypothetical protein